MINDSNRTLPLSPGLNYSISCTTSLGFYASNKPWHRVLENGTETLISHTSPADTTGNTVYAFVNSDGKVSLRFQNFSVTDVGTYRCVSPTDSKTIIVTTCKLKERERELVYLKEKI